MSHQPSILLLGAAGYIGGTVLDHLLQRGTPATSITALVKDTNQAQLFEPLGIKTVQGRREDLEALRNLAAQHDVVLNFAVAFGGDEESIGALIEGLESRASQSGQVKPVYIHTGGSGTVLEGQDGQAPQVELWTDEQYDRLNQLPETAYFMGGYRKVAEAALRGQISAFTIVSPTVYGPGTGPGNRLSLQMPAYVRYAKQTKRAAYVGQGDNVWGNVHVADLAQLYLFVMDHALHHPETIKASQQSHGFETLLYSGADQHTWRPVIEHLGNLLHARGEVDAPAAISIKEGEGMPYMFGGSSVLAKSEKAAKLGWKPQQPDLIGALNAALGSK